MPSDPSLQFGSSAEVGADRRDAVAEGEGEQGVVVFALVEVFAEAFEQALRRLALGRFPLDDVRNGVPRALARRQERGLRAGGGHALGPESVAHRRHRVAIADRKDLPLDAGLEGQGEAYGARDLGIPSRRIVPGLGMVGGGHRPLDDVLSQPHAEVGQPIQPDPSPLGPRKSVVARCAGLVFRRRRWGRRRHTQIVA